MIGLDLGTSAVKGVLMSSAGDVVHREKAELPYLRPQEGFVEFDGEAFYRLVAGVIRKLASHLPEGASAAGVGVSSASGNTLLVDASGRPMRPAISWMDSRVTREVEEVFGELDPAEVYRLIGWPLSRRFPLAHLSWLKCHEPGLLATAAKVCMSTEYVNYRLTGEWGIDNSSATTFFLQDQEGACWHRPFLEKLGISEEELPEIKRPGEVLGHIHGGAAPDTGLAPGTPVVLGSFDHPSAARGSGVTEEGQLLLSCGTSWVGFYPVRDREKALKKRLLIDPFLADEGIWGAMFSLPEIANAVDRYICRCISDGPGRFAEFDRLSAMAAPGAGGLFINPRKGHELADTGSHSKEDIARALMEGTAFLLKMRIDDLKEAGFNFSSVVMVGGPSETFPWPQIVCDVLGLSITVRNGSCAGAVGAAILAGVGAGLYRDLKDAHSRLDFAERILKPDRAAHEAYQDLYRKFKDTAV